MVDAEDAFATTAHAAGLSPSVREDIGRQTLTLEICPICEETSHCRHPGCTAPVDACCVACASLLSIWRFWGEVAKPQKVSRCHEHCLSWPCPCRECKGGAVALTSDPQDRWPRMLGGSECAIQSCG